MVVPITAARTVPDLIFVLDRIPYLAKNTRYSVFWSPIPQHVVIVNENEFDVKGTYLVFMALCEIKNDATFYWCECSISANFLINRGALGPGIVA